MSFDQDPGEQANISGADLAILIDELKEVKCQRDKLLRLLEQAVGGIVYLAEEANCHAEEWREWDREARAAIASVERSKS